VAGVASGHEYLPNLPYKTREYMDIYIYIRTDYTLPYIDIYIYLYTLMLLLLLLPPGAAYKSQIIPINPQDKITKFRPKFSPQPPTLPSPAIPPSAHTGSAEIQDGKV
jgi:hypothetical protein